MKKKLKLLSLAALLLIMVLTTLYGCTDEDGKSPTDGSTESAETIHEKNTDVPDPLRIGVPSIEIPPMIIREGDIFSGFEIDLIAETIDRLGVSYEIIPIDPGTERELLEDGIIDCAWGNMMDTGKQRLFYSMTDSYITIPQVVAVYEDSKISDIKDIKSISVIMSSPAESLADEDKLEVDCSRVSSSKDYEKTFELIRNGGSDAVVCDKTTADYMITRDGKIKIIEDNAAQVRYSVAFRQKDEKMMLAVDKTLKDIFSEGILPNLSLKWFGQDYYIIK